MYFCGKVDDVLRPEHVLSLMNDHFPDLDLFLIAGLLVHLEVFRKRLLELQCYALSHHTDTVDCVHQGLCFFFEQVGVVSYLYHGIILHGLN